MRLLLIESSPGAERSLPRRFREAGFEIDAVEDADLGLDLAERRQPDVILLDVMPCGVDGVELLVRLRQRETAARVIILTPRRSVTDTVRALHAGADDCLPKPIDFEELLARVRALVRSHRSTSSEIRIDDLVIDTAAYTVTLDGCAVSLTKREFLILEYLAQRRGEIVPRHEIEDHLYGVDNSPLSNAVPSAICLLRKKLGEVASRCLVHTRRGSGYCLDPARNPDRDVLSLGT